MATHKVGPGILDAMVRADDAPAGDEVPLAYRADGKTWRISTAPGVKAAYVYYADSNQVYACPKA